MERELRREREMAVRMNFIIGRFGGGGRVLQIERGRHRWVWREKEREREREREINDVFAERKSLSRMHFNFPIQQRIMAHAANTAIAGLAINVRPVSFCVGETRPLQEVFLFPISSGAEHGLLPYRKEPKSVSI